LNLTHKKLRKWQDELQELDDGKCQILSILINIFYVVLLMCIEIYVMSCLFSEDNNGNELQANVCLELENLVTVSVFDQFPMTSCVLCAVHTFQLSVYNTWKEKSISGILSKARKVSSIIKL